MAHLSAIVLVAKDNLAPSRLQFWSPTLPTQDNLDNHARVKVANIPRTRGLESGPYSLPDGEQYDIDTSTTSHTFGLEGPADFFAASFGMSGTLLADTLIPASSFCGQRFQVDVINAARVNSELSSITVPSLICGCSLLHRCMLTALYFWGILL